LCVHSRRGDFLSSYEQAASSTTFTLPAIQFVLRELNSTKNPLVIMIGDDLQWQSDVTEQIKN
ncbi:hypothetical protein PFISCL1PPCAC_3510, partial [Pristionchus fissidentatus]